MWLLEINWQKMAVKPSPKGSGVCMCVRVHEIERESERERDMLSVTQMVQYLTVERSQNDKLERIQKEAAMI